MAANTWVDVDEDTARQYAYYGVGGWLALFLILYGLGAVANVVGAIVKVPDMVKYANFLPAPVMILSWIEIAAGVILGIILFILVIRGFRKELGLADRLIGYLKLAVAVSLIVQGLWIVEMLAIPEVKQLMEMSQGSDVISNSIIGYIVVVVVAVLICGLQIWYFRQSKRVNATYRNRLLAGHPTTAQLLKH